METPSGLCIVEEGNPPCRPPCPEGRSRTRSHQLGLPHLYVKIVRSLSEIQINWELFYPATLPQTSSGGRFLRCWASAGGDLAIRRDNSHESTFCSTFLTTHHDPNPSLERPQNPAAGRECESINSLCGPFSRASSLRPLGLGWKGGNLGLLPLQSFLNNQSRSNRGVVLWSRGSGTLSRLKGRKPTSIEKEKSEAAVIGLGGQIQVMPAAK